MTRTQRLWLISALGTVVLLFVLVIALDEGKGNRTLDLAGILLGWPVVIGLLIAFLVTRFHAEIAEFIREHEVRVQTRRGTTIETNRQQPSPEVSEEEIPAPSEDVEKTVQKTYSDQEINAVWELVAQQNDRAERWFFRYLDIFFVPLTKLVLWWFSQSTGPVTRKDYEAFWSKFISDPAQRDTIVDVLLANGLIQETFGVISVTDTGRRYLEHVDSLEQPITDPGISANE
jgi:uncharacterized integral membrane protein